VDGGRKSKLGDDSGKLFFILFYYRHYPTLRLAQVLFDLETLIFVVGCTYYLRLYLML